MRPERPHEQPHEHNLMNNMNNSAAHDLSTHGWPTAFIGELDHRILRAPGVKLRSVRQGTAGDQVFCVDLRIRRPNADEFPPVAVLHSMEHFRSEERRVGKECRSAGEPYR